MNNQNVISTRNSTPGTLNMVDYGQLKQRMAQLQEFIKDYMVPGEDFGIIEGTNSKPTLLKPGAEKLCDVYGLAIGQPVINRIRDDSQTPVYIHYEVITPLISRIDGMLITNGVGSCNSYEKKYKWRWAWENELDKHINPADLKTRNRGQSVQYQVPNDEIDDLDNTLLKMAKKRSLIDAVLSATRSSALFTQDVEDLPGMEIKQQDTSKRDKQRQERGSQNQQSGGFSGGRGVEDKNKALDMMKAMRLSWDDLAEVASAALDRKINRVLQDIKPDEWAKVRARLQTMEIPA